MENIKAVFMGLGYIGLPTATVAAGKGLQVVGVDINEKVIETINRGQIHIVEPGLQQLVQSVVEAGNLRASLLPEEADVFLIVVPTPFKGGNHEAHEKGHRIRSGDGDGVHAVSRRLHGSLNCYGCGGE